ncbi:neuritin-like protein [Vidua macroura]|uniref:neuritin-like protein n=1 Tax=Vidua chalybeata TaxID=81927 RepID=UPI0023A7FE51|nr:neuritin-like protein [Vidua chalybeata]XP_053843446.1 neuritin-like protein [Vidua macroura]
MGGGCWRLLGVVCPLLLHLAASQEPVSMAGQCDTIYKGFAECLLSLGESMARSVRQQQQEEGGDEAQELDAICKSWDDFHTCASEALSRCPVEAATVWESLRQESRKIQFQGNLQELCSARGRLASAQSSPASETNQATLRGSATALHPRLLALLALLALPLLLPRL